MPKHYQDLRCIANAASKRRCSAGVGVQLTNDSLYGQASSIPLAPETSKAIPLPNESLQQDYSSSTYMIYPNRAPWYRQDGRYRGSGASQIAFQNIRVSRLYACPRAWLNASRINHAKPRKQNVLVTVIPATVRLTLCLIIMVAAIPFCRGFLIFIHYRYIMTPYYHRMIICSLH